LNVVYIVHDSLWPLGMNGIFKAPLLHIHTPHVSI
jgi:hypothetical protein